MKIGVPKEIKDLEFRVGMTPMAVKVVVDAGHDVIIETKLGESIGYLDSDYTNAGAVVVETSQEVFASSELITKVKEPQTEEIALLRQGQVIFTYLHLAPDSEQTQGLIDSGAVCIAYETVAAPNGELPLLAPMSEVAGRMSIQAGAACLEKSRGGSGILLGGVPGVAAAKVVIVGGGVVGRHAAQMALGMGANVTLMDNNHRVLRELNTQFGTQVDLVYSNSATLQEQVEAADLVVGGVLVPGATAPKLISREMVKNMRFGSVIVDVAIDQGGCVETAYATTHSAPTYIEEGVVHYCVANIPSAVARTASLALNNATLAYIVNLADKGWQAALSENEYFAQGLNVCYGRVTNKAVAQAQSLDFVEPAACFGV